MPKNAIIILLIILGIGMFIYLAVNTGLSTLKERTRQNKDPNTPASSSDRSITVDKVVENPAVFSDLTVTLEGRITDWSTKQSFSISTAKRNFSGGRTLPILTRNQFKLPDDTPQSELALGETADVKVTGKIVIFDRGAIEDEWGVDLFDKELDRWNKTPVMLAEKVEKL